ncbi:lamin tail domain-containing protein [Flavobacteriaceae bacterium XHP0103]|uniref:arabinofuranosidase catalytic domain-containing protein n=1 Tax=Marixanthotalea marina TaxID=2844359 RepID=UPI002989CA91|nr:arabinofuranosidase catalytic domain-containing protein [Marixanthotalea marina]MBU3822222.1 lamin tail domain-containing protein [Marixanthotalea marina]
MNTRKSSLSTLVFLSFTLLIFLSSCKNTLARPEGPGDIYAVAGFTPTAAHSTTRALFANYDGPLYQLTRESDGETLDIGVVQPSAGDPGGYADAAAQDAFCVDSSCWISIIYDQSGNGNDLKQAPPGTFRGVAKGGFNSLPLADMAPITINGHKVYGTFIMPGSGLRNNNAVGLAINDEPEGIYMVLDGTHYSSGCCFNYGNTSTSSRAVGTGTMSTVYYGTATAWGKGEGEGPWIMSDMEAGLFSGYETKENAANPTIDSWRFVTGMVNGGGGNQWEIWGADAQTDSLINFYKGERPQSKENDTYFPMHRKGSIQLGNGGDNGNGSAGTFYEGIMTSGYPTEAVVKAVQENIAAANYNVPTVDVSRLTSFTPKSSKELTVTFTNTSSKPVSNVELTLEMPEGWPSVGAKTLSESIAPGATIETIFNISSPESVAAGYLRAKATWSDKTYETSQRIRNVLPIKINEASFSGGDNPTNQFLELYNTSTEAVDISNWMVINTPGEGAPLEMGRIPEGTTLGAGEFYLFGLAPSGLVAPVSAGDNSINVRSTEGLKLGQEIIIDTEKATISNIGTPASEKTIVFVPVSTGPWLHFPAGTTNLPVANADGFKVGDKIGIDLGGNYEVATVTEVGKAATQSNLAEPAKVGDTIIKVWRNANMSPGDTLTINTGARIELAVVKNVIKEVQRPYRGRFEGEPGEVELVAPLQKDHMLEVDVSSPGTGISFTPATRFAHKSGDAVQALGSGVTLKTGLAENHNTGAPILFSGATHVGYQGNVEANQYYGLPMSIYAGSIALMHGDVLMDALIYGSPQGNSSSRGSVATPEIAILEGDQGQGGCIAVLPGSSQGSFTDAYDPMIRSLGRYPNGQDTDSNCEDFTSQTVMTLASATSVGSKNIKLASVDGLSAGQSLVIGTGANTETVIITQVGTPGATKLTASVSSGSTSIPVDNIFGFSEGQSITIGTGSRMETVEVSEITRPRRNFANPSESMGASITISKGLKYSHSKGEALAGSGITLSNALNKIHKAGEQVSSSLPTPGEVNQF